MRRLVFGVLAGLVVGCFDAPAAAVMFSCEPDGASACPDGYSCEADGCCHRDGTDVDAHLGECKLAGGSDGATTLLPGTSSSGTDATTTGGPSEGTSTGDTSTGDTSTGDTSTGDTSTGSSTSM
jgi:hypothetical protein